MGAGLIAVPVVVVVVAVVAVFFLRTQLGVLKDAAGAGDAAPFLFGVPPPKRIMAETSWPVTVAGQPATVSVTTQYRGIAASPGPAAGTLWLEVSLGPEWPAVGVRPRDVTMSIGRSLGRRAGLATTEVATGDPAFDARYWSGVSTGDPARARGAEPDQRASDG